MTYKYSYKDSIERAKIITENNDKFLIEEQNITEGNFLIFADEPLIIEIPRDARLDVIEQDLIMMKSALDDLILGGIF